MKAPYGSAVERLAGAPISWGVCEVPGWGIMLPRDRVLSEMRDLGLKATELGALYHGPSMAAPGYDLYYLNVMAGSGERAWLASDDPAHAWVRATWASQAVDPRLGPSSVSAQGRPR